MVAAVCTPRTARGQQLITGVAILLATTGMALAARQLWLQQAPPTQNTLCSHLNLQGILQHYNLLEGLALMLAGTGECATVDFTILGLSLAAWSFICFLGLCSVFVLHLRNLIKS